MTTLIVRSTTGVATATQFLPCFVTALASPASSSGVHLSISWPLLCSGAATVAVPLVGVQAADLLREAVNVSVTCTAATATVGMGKGP
jgi:hypothetical protein